jgi:hypothetical protein
MSMMLDVLFVRDSGRTVFSVTCRVDDKAVCTPMFSRDQTMFGAALQQAIVGLRWSVWPEGSIRLGHSTPSMLHALQWLCRNAVL